MYHARPALLTVLNMLRRVDKNLTILYPEFSNLFSKLQLERQR
jgi:hypothetical protein